jgi:hypothetical protein
MTIVSNNVMKKVRVIFWARRLMSRRALECYMLFISTLGLFSFVSVPHVIANMPPATNTLSLFNFMITAATHTHVIVQIILTLMCISLGCIAFDFFRISVHRSNLQKITSA